MKTEALVAFPPALSIPPSAETFPSSAAEARFTVDGSNELEGRLAQTCRTILAGIRGVVPPHRLEGVLLGGGYGRGEGGVLQTISGDEPYNDLELYIFVRGNRHGSEWWYRRPLEVLAEILTPLAGVEVEFKITSFTHFARQPTGMFSYDLAMGHRWLLGATVLLARCAHHREAARIPLAEATRLLMNRCSGLLFAQDKLASDTFTAADADFVRRNIAKAELALGDAVLTVHGAYHWSCQERNRRLRHFNHAELVPHGENVCVHHANGVRFKLHPERSTASRDELQKLFDEVSALALRVWLWVETRRLGQRFSSARAYVESCVDKCPETDCLRNLLVNLKVTRLRDYVRATPWKHPRQTVLESLVLLLWTSDALIVPALLRRLQRTLNTRATRFPDLVHAYRSFWQQVS